MTDLGVDVEATLLVEAQDEADRPWQTVDIVRLIKIKLEIILQSRIL